MKYYCLLALTARSVTAFAQIPTIRDSTENINTDFHFQLTTVTQRKYKMPAPYTGNNSLTGDRETLENVSA
jgi:hypothetical protein